MNRSQLNGVALNGGTASHTKYAEAVLSAGVSIFSAIASVYVVGASIQSAASDVVAAGVVEKVAAAELSATSNSYANSALYYVERLGACQASGNVDIVESSNHNHAVSVDAEGNVNIIAFQGDSIAYEGNSDIDTTDVGIAYSAKASVEGNASAATNDSVIYRILTGVDVISGSATVWPVATFRDFSDSNNDYHDGHVIMSVDASISLPSAPEQTEKMLDALVTGETEIQTVGASINHHVSVSMQGGADYIDDAHLNSVPATTITLGGVSLTATVTIDAGGVADISATSNAYFTCYKRAEIVDFELIGAIDVAVTPAFDVIAQAAIEGGSDLGNDVAQVVAQGAISASGNVIVLASMRSNPRAHAVARRTLIVPEEKREVYVHGEERIIYIGAA